MIAAGSKTTIGVPRASTPSDPTLGFAVFAERGEGVEYSLEHAVIGGEDRFLVLHNASGPDFELAVAPIDPTPRDGWHPLIAHDPAVRLEDVDAFAGHLVVHQRSRGLTQLRILELDDHGVGDDYLVEFDEEIYTVGSAGNPTFEQPTVRLGYTTHGRPVVGLRLRRAHPRAAPCSSAHPCSVRDWGLRPRRLRGAPALGHRRRRRAGADLDRLPARRA